MSDALLSLLAILVFAFAVILVLVRRFPDQIGALLGQVDKIEAGTSGFAISFASGQLRKAAKQKGLTVETVTPRAGGWKGKSILWVDNLPGNNFHEAAMFEALGADVRFAVDNAEAVAAMREKAPDLVISDIGRGPARESGLRLPDAVSTAGLPLPPLVYYTGHATAPATPAGHPVVDRPDTLYREVAALLGTA